MKAKNITSRQDYYQYVNESVNIFIDELNEDISDIHHSISMNVDQSRIIMMYSNNLTVLQYSDNEPQEWSHLVGNDESNWRKVIQSMAYDVFRQDFYEKLEEKIDLRNYE